MKRFKDKTNQFFYVFAASFYAFAITAWPCPRLICTGNFFFNSPGEHALKNYFVSNESVHEMKSPDLLRFLCFARCYRRKFPSLKRAECWTSSPFLFISALHRAIVDRFYYEFREIGNFMFDSIALTSIAWKCSLFFSNKPFQMYIQYFTISKRM